jgi:hypothetical protein
LKELTKGEKISLGTKEIAKRIRQHLKDEFPGCKFSVRTDYYSMGSSIDVSLMKADRKIKLRFEEIPDKALCSYYANRYTQDELKKAQDRDYHQLGHFYGEYDINKWCNGVFLTYQGYMLLKRVEQIANYYNYDDSDSMTDYYSVNFSFSLELGKYDKPFIDGDSFKVDDQLMNNIRTRQTQVEANIKKEKEREKLRQIEIDQLRKDNENKAHIPSGATHVIDGSGFRQLTVEEKETGQLRDKLEKKWFNGSVNWKKYVFEL